MLESYDDIKDKLGEPAWWDEHGVPRYCEFHPQRCGVYIDRAVLMVVDCQGCERTFLVAETWSEHEGFLESLHSGRPTWPSTPRSGWPPYYGDPPAHHCVGDTMSSGTIDVRQVWRRDVADWRRDADEETKMRAALHERPPAVAHLD